MYIYMLKYRISLLKYITCIYVYVLPILNAHVKYYLNGRTENERNDNWPSQNPWKAGKENEHDLDLGKWETQICSYYSLLNL